MAIRFVNPSGSNTSPYDTEAKAATTIQTAITGSLGSDIIAIRNDADYVFGATISLVAGLFFVGYQQTGGQPTAAIFDGDMSLGGGFYKVSRVVVDTNGGAFPAFTYAANVQSSFSNIEIKGVPVTQMPIDLTTNTTQGVGQASLQLDNCNMAGGEMLDLVNLNSPIIRDSKFTGTWSTVDGKPFIGCITQLSSGIISGNFFSPLASEGYINIIDAGGVIDSGPTIYGNIFSMSGNVLKEMIRSVHGGSMFNNVFYQPSGFTVGTSIQAGVQKAALSLLTASATQQYMNIHSNIFQSAESGANRFEGIVTDKTLWHSSHNCLFNTDNSNYTLTATDISGNPQFLDPVNDDFRLKATSPCFNTGLPTLAGDDIFGKSTMGAWQAAQNISFSRLSLTRHG